MSTLAPHGELVRKAAAYVAETLGENPKRQLEDILTDAGMRFNLTPLDSENLRRLFEKDKA